MRNPLMKLTLGFLSVMLIVACGLEKRINNDRYRCNSDRNVQYATAKNTGDPIPSSCLVSSTGIDSHLNSTSVTNVKVRPPRSSFHEIIRSTHVSCRDTDRVFLSKSGKRKNLKGCVRKAYEPRKEDIYDLKNIAVFAIILGILGVLVFGIGLATEIIELFLGGFILGGLSEWISIFGLVKIYKITRKFPELKPKNGERNIKFTNPYLSKPDPNAELKSLRKARTIALWLFWLCYVVVGFGFLAVLGVFIRQ